MDSVTLEGEDILQVGDKIYKDDILYLIVQGFAGTSVARFVHAQEPDVKIRVERVIPESLAAQLAALVWARWIPVSERLPEEAGYYLAAGMYKAKNISWVSELYFSYDHEWFRGDNEWHSVTHWMPLPPAPATDAGEGDAVPKRVRVVKCTNPAHWWANRIGEVFEVDQVYDDASGDVWVFDGDQSYLMSIADTEPVTDEPAPAPARAETESEPR